MSEEHYDYLVFILRGQPFHLGHKSVIDIALSKAKHVILFLGSANRPRSPRNPWTFEERANMVKDTYLSNSESKTNYAIRQHDGSYSSHRISIEPLNDHLYTDNNWIKEVQAKVQEIAKASTHPNPKIGLIGHAKDNTSYYLKKFPQWGSVEAAGYDEHHLCNATDIRRQYLAPYPDDFGSPRWKDDCPEATIKTLETFKHTNEYLRLRDEQEYCEQYKKDHQFSGKPYKPVQVTVDAVVIQSGHILLIERRAYPGKGLIALPGGFLDAGEALEDSMIRELREETRLKIPERVLRGSITKRHPFDDPNRSSRGRIITHAFLIELEPTETLPKVKGGDDAKRAFWKPLSELNSREMFEDHYFIIQYLTGVQ